MKNESQNATKPPSVSDLLEGWLLFKASLTYRKSHPGYTREYYEVDKHVIDRFELLLIALRGPTEPQPTVRTGVDVGEDPFTGPHWKQAKINAEMGFTDARCILDLAMMQRGQYVSIVDFEDRIHKLEERM